ncbi:MAG: hypothetical protein IPK60_10020 [Sandaracinaceae bacterium]|nr:hypothetical protein [Sandaracinaceae bacterium]
MLGTKLRAFVAAGAFSVCVTACGGPLSAPRAHAPASNAPQARDSENPQSSLATQMQLASALPAEVNGALPLPMASWFVARNAGGQLLVRSMAMFADADDPGSAASGEYYSVVAGDSGCIVETHGPESEIETAAYVAELGGLRELARRFGLRSLGGAVFDSVSTLGIVPDDNGRVYAIDHERATLMPNVRGFSATFSPDAHWLAFASCRGRCGHEEIAARMHAAIPRVRYPSGTVHDMYWAPDNTLYFSYDDTTRALQDATRVCIGHLDPATSAPATVVLCKNSSVNSTMIFVASSNVRFGALETMNSSGFVTSIIDLQTHQETASIPQPLLRAVDDEGRFAWQTPEGVLRIQSGTEMRELEGVEPVGFVEAGVLLVQRTLEGDIEDPEYLSDPENSVAHHRCDTFRAVRLTQN